MKEVRGKVEGVAEKTREAVGKVVKKDRGTTKDIGKGAMKGVKGEEEKQNKE